MKKRNTMKLLAVMFIWIVCLTACAKKEESVPAVKEETSQEDKDEPKEETPKGNELEKEKEEQTVTPAPVNITIFYSNDDATGFAAETISVAALSPEAVLDALISKGALPAEVKVLSLNQTENAGKKSLDIDVNNAYATFVQSMGTAGEYYAIGSVVNSFLNAYGCEQVKITVEGQPLTSGHAEYPGYMSQYQ